MTKKLLLCILCLILCSFYGCSKKETNNKILIAYFSCFDDTKTLAQMIQKETNGTLFEILPLETYKEEDFTNTTSSRIWIEQNDVKCRPIIQNTLNDINDYETIYLGFPIWLNQTPKIIYTFLESYDFKNQTIFPFCSSQSNDTSYSLNELQSQFRNLHIREGKIFYSPLQEEIKKWITSKEEENKVEQIYITIQETKLTMTLEHNQATEELIKKLPITVMVDDYGGFEKVGSLGFNLPTSNQNITTSYGDVVLYNGNQIVLFYGSNQWSYTRLGKIQNRSANELKEIFSSGKISITLSLD